MNINILLGIGGVIVGLLIIGAIVLRPYKWPISGHGDTYFASQRKDNWL